MKTTKTKYVLVLLANYVLVLCACLFYRFSIAQYMWPIFIVLQIIFVILNHMVTNNKSALLVLHANLLISTIAANWLFTHLYFTRISSDDETLIVGTAGLVYGAILVVILSMISFLIRVFAKANKKIS